MLGSAGHFEDGQGCPIPLGCLVCPMQETGNQPYHNNSLPPIGQWPSGKISPRAQGLPAGRLAATDWLSHLPWVLLGLRAAPKEDHNSSSAELLYGVLLTLPGELLDVQEPPAAIFLEHLHSSPSSLQTRPL